MDTEQQGTSTETPTPDQGYDAIVAEAMAIELTPDEVTPPATETAPATAATDPEQPAAPATDPAAPSAPAATAETPAPPAEGTTDAAPPTTEPAPTWTFKVDGRDVTLQGAREDGENIVIPKQVWHSEVKNFLADRGAFAQRERDMAQRHQAEMAQVRQSRGAEEKIAKDVLTELDRIMLLPEAESFDEWEKMRTGYPERKAKVEAAHWQEQATGAQTAEVTRVEQDTLARLDQALDGEIVKYAGQAVEAVKDQLSGMDDAERQEFAERLTELLREDAMAGRLFYLTDQVIPGTRLRVPAPNFQRVAAVVDREVKVVRRSLERTAALKQSVAQFEAAAKKNAEAAARRAGVGGAPPPVSPKGTSAEPVKETAPQSWDEVMAQAAKL